MSIPPILNFAHELVSRALGAGDVAVDATVGNGRDTVVLAQAVGEGGSVYGFDVQRQALQNARDRLETEGAEGEVELIHASHEEVKRYVPAGLHGQVGATMFNLGYLPGSRSWVTTEAETTVAALQASCDLLRPGGVVTVVLYTGHEGGTEEARAVEAWGASLSQNRFHVLSYSFVNRRNDPPRLLAVEKRVGQADRE